MDSLSSDIPIPPVVPSAATRLLDASADNMAGRTSHAEDVLSAVVLSHSQDDTSSDKNTHGFLVWIRRLYRGCIRLPLAILGRLWDLASLTVMLAVVAALPVLQLASLGYLLHAAAILASGGKWSSALPGLRTAGKLGVFILLATVTWLPVWFVTDLSYSAQLLIPGSRSAAVWRIAAFAITLAWIVLVAWAAMRGGRWWHFVWPAPIRFVKQFFLPSTWQRASRDLSHLVASLSFLQLWWLGARGALGALLWTCVPVSLIIIGLRADQFPLAIPIGVLGVASMAAVAMYLPHLQVQMAVDNRLLSIMQIQRARKRFNYAPLAHAGGLLLMCLLSIPLYLLRIEATPAELLWAPSLIFVLFMLPVKLALGATIGYAERRRAEGLQPRAWWVKWPGRLLSLTSITIYVFALVLAQLFAGQGALTMYFQHAFLVPSPLIGN
ncbi:MAG: hypothetical protein KDB00_04540 [Planctomycetales bacterium]|nr:hypothetical protein [Planctomycetales bacterium]